MMKQDLWICNSCLADFVTDCSTTAIVCWAKWNLLLWYILKQLTTVCKLSDTWIKCILDTLENLYFFPTKMGLWRQNVLWNNQKRILRKRCVFWSNKIHHPFHVIVCIAFMTFSVFSRKKRTFQYISNNFENILQPLIGIKKLH